MIRPPGGGELDTVARFIASLQARPEERNGYFGESLAEVRALLESWERPWVDTSVVAERSGRLTGFLGAELADSAPRVWLHGPVVVDPDWDRVADELLAALLARFPELGDREQELVGDAANTRLGTFGKRHGFLAGAVHHVLELPAAAIAALPSAPVVPLGAAHEGALARLHDELFPRTYYSAHELLEQAARGDATVLGLVEPGNLTGYVAGRIDEAGEGYIDFVGVSGDDRRRGYGTALVGEISRALAKRASITKVSLTVSTENPAALALYDRLGFTKVSSAVGYRRPAEAT